MCSVYFAVFGLLPGVDAKAAEVYSGSDINHIEMFECLFAMPQQRYPPTVTLPAFKSYLETRGLQISHKTPQFLPFYALPYVPDPKAHPSFKEVFVERWWKEIEGRVEEVVTGGSGEEKGRGKGGWKIPKLVEVSTKLLLVRMRFCWIENLYCSFCPSSNFEPLNNIKVVLSFFLQID